MHFIGNTHAADASPTQKKINMGIAEATTEMHGASSLIIFHRDTTVSMQANKSNWKYTTKLTSAENMP